MAMTLKTEVTRSDTDITGIFAQKMEAAFGGRVSVLPAVAILNEARRLGQRHTFVEISVELDADEPGQFTVYSVGSNIWSCLRAMYLVDGYTGETVDFDDVFDGLFEGGGGVEEFCEKYPQAGNIIRKYIDETP